MRLPLLYDGVVDIFKDFFDEYGGYVVDSNEFGVRLIADSIEAGTTVKINCVN